MFNIQQNNLWHYFNSSTTLKRHPTDYNQCFKSHSNIMNNISFCSPEDGTTSTADVSDISMFFASTSMLRKHLHNGKLVVQKRLYFSRKKTCKTLNENVDHSVSSTIFNHILLKRRKRCYCFANNNLEQYLFPEILRVPSHLFCKQIIKILYIFENIYVPSVLLLLTIILSQLFYANAIILPGAPNSYAR